MKQELDNQKKMNYILISLIIVLVISQSFSIYYIYSTSQKNTNKINEFQTTNTENLAILSKDLQNKINSLTDSLTQLSSTQNSLEKQVSTIKAQTSADFSGIIEQEIQGVVTIKTDVAQGTGFILTSNGYIVTNAHVLSQASFANIYTYDNKKYSSSLIGYNSNMDIAVLKISGNFQSLTLGNSDDVKIGEKVIAIGNPLGLSFTATEGIISARDRIGSNNLPYYFQTDVSMNPGNSGGPLIDTSGNVIGINNFKISGAENLGFALESNYIKESVNAITLKALNQTILN